MSKDKEEIICEEHGESTMAYVCTHIYSAKDDEVVGFYQSYIDLLNDEVYEYNAWCKDCDERLSQAGNEWNDLLEKQADIKTVCLSCFENFKDKQLSLNPAEAEVCFVPENKDITKFYDRADAHINLANKKTKKEKPEDISESFLFAASRFAAFEATLTAKDIEKNKTDVIDYYALRFREMFVDNLTDYIENKKEYLKESK